MNLRYQQTGDRAIVYDADRIPLPDAELFDPAWWRARGGIVGEARGRGSTLMLDTAFGPAVLRPYLRGGWAARFSPDHYLFTGFARSRPIREARMLARLSTQGLPVPPPLAGVCVRHGVRYKGALLMRRIAPATPLAERLGELGCGDPAWVETGQVIRRLHEAGVVHADLNARNVLLGADGSVHLLDFDRARFAPRARARFRANLDRLRRSLAKSWPAGRAHEFPDCWDSLMRGYQVSPLSQSGSGRAMA